jgi:hypothetical protein
MLEANLLLNTTGGAPDSFATMDPLRLPLGISSGVGFYRRRCDLEARRLGARCDHSRHNVIGHGDGLCMTVAAASFHEREFRAALEAQGRKITSRGIRYVNLARVRKVNCELHWRSRESGKDTPPFVEELARRRDVSELEWER